MAEGWLLMNRFESVQTQLDKEPAYSFGGRFSDFLPDEDRGFVSNVVESWKRGDEQILSDIAIYEAMRSGENLDDALDLRKKYLRKEVVDPVQGNFISNLVYKGVKIVPGWFRSAKEAIPMTLAGAGVGAGVALVAGQLGPQVALPEEIATVPAGVLAGAKVGFTMGSALFWYKQGAGGMFADMIEKGYDPQKSWKIAQVAAVPYAALEFMQIKAATPVFKKGLQGVLAKSSQSIIGQFGRSYLSKLGQEVGEEVAQEAVQIVAEDVAGYASGQGVDFDKDAFYERVSRLANVAWQSIQAMALLPVPGATIETVVNVTTQKAFDQAKAEESRQRLDKSELIIDDGERTYTVPPEVEPLTVDIMAENVKKFGMEKLQSDFQNWLKSPEGIAERESLGLPETTDKVLQAKRDTLLWETFNRGLVTPTNLVSFTYDGKLVQFDYSMYGREAAGLVPTDPLGKLQFALMKSTEKYQEMKLIHKQELADKFTRAESALNDSPNAREGLKNARGKMAGVLTELKIEPVESVMSGEDWESIFSEIRETERLTTPEKINLAESLEGLLRDGTLLRPYEIKLFGKQFGPLMEQTLTNLTEATKKTVRKQTATELLSIPKAISASGDVSRTFRQNILLIGNLPAFFKGAMAEWKLFLNDENYAREVEKTAMTGDYAPIWRRTVLRINEWGGRGTYATRSEKYTAQVPWLGRSERAYTVGGNLVRIYLFNQIAKEWENDTTKKYSLKDYNDLAHVINIMTGEGDARIFGEHAAAINATFFAPRLAVSRFQAVLEIFNPKRSWAARKILAHAMVRFVGTNTLILGLLSTIPGCTVDKDPRSTDFGKLKFGNTRIEFWGGYQPMVRMIIELIKGKHKTQSGQIIDTKRFETITRFLQAKLAPVPAATLDFLRGETFYGEEVVKDADGLLFEAYSRLTPFVVQDIIDAARYQGLSAAAITAPLAFHGIGVQTYDQTPATKVSIMKDRMAQEVFGQNWRDLGSEAQKGLREYFPEIETEEVKLNYEYQSPKYIQKILQDEYRSEKRILKGLSSSIVTRLVDSKVRVGGLGKRVGSDWYLNDERFKEYEQLTITALNKILPSIFSTPGFGNLLFTEQQLILGDVIAEVKNEIRQYIIQKANYKDLEYLYGKQ